jgi:isochorismate pyruvate lyase
MVQEKIEVCLDINDVRRNIDAIDKALVSLIAKRGAYVKQASEFKSTTAEVEAPKRVEQVIQKVTEIARNEGANIKVVQSVWRTMISVFTEVEMEEWKRKLHGS